MAGEWRTRRRECFGTGQKHSNARTFCLLMRPESGRVIQNLLIRILYKHSYLINLLSKYRRFIRFGEL